MNNQAYLNKPMPDLQKPLWESDLFIISQNLTSTGILTKNIDQPLLKGNLTAEIFTDKPIRTPFRMGIMSYSKNNYFSDGNKIIYVEDNSF